jgi:hypothetical protein
MHSHECWRLHYIRMPLTNPNKLHVISMAPRKLCGISQTTLPIFARACYRCVKPMGGEHSQNAQHHQNPHLMLHPLFWGMPPYPTQSTRLKKNLKLYLKRCMIHMLNAKPNVDGWCKICKICRIVDMHILKDVSIHVCPSYFVL